jgi:hypothetical protein
MLCHINPPPSNKNTTVQDDTTLLSLTLATDVITTIPGVPPELSEFNCNVVAYIAGFVIRKIVKPISCTECMEALVKLPPTPHHYDRHLHLIQLRDNGGLIYPSDDAMAVCKASERVFRMYNGITTPSPMANLMETMVGRAARDMIKSGVFSSPQHTLDPTNSFLHDPSHGESLVCGNQHRSPVSSSQGV